MASSFRFTMVPGFEKLLEPEGRKLAVQVANLIAQDAKDNAPVDTGFLRDNISVEETSEGAIVAANADYAADVELGTSKMAAQPFLRPAAYTQRSL